MSSRLRFGRLYLQHSHPIRMAEYLRERQLFGAMKRSSFSVMIAQPTSQAAKVV